MNQEPITKQETIEEQKAQQLLEENDADSRAPRLHVCRHLT